MCISHELGIFGSRHSCIANPKILRWAINYLVVCGNYSADRRTLTASHINSDC